MKFEHVPYGNRIEFELNEEQRRRIDSGESPWDVFMYPTLEAKRQSKIRQRAARFARCVSDAAFACIKQSVAAGDFSPISKEVVRFLIDTLVEWEAYE